MQGAPRLYIDRGVGGVRYGVGQVDVRDHRVVGAIMKTRGIDVVGVGKSPAAVRFLGQL